MISTLIYCIPLLTISSPPLWAKSIESAKAIVKNAEGHELGTASFTQLQKGVKINLDLQHLPQGRLAVHIHEKGECKTPDFKSAGGHFTAPNLKHGFDLHEGPHSGDLPNIIVGADGKAQVEFINPFLALSSESLFRKDGTALVIHAKEDDYKSQPAGNAGDRIACGVIKK